MKICANMNYLQATTEQLEKRITILRQACEEVQKLEEKIKYMAYTDHVRRYLKESKKSLEENIRVLQSMADAFREIEKMYRMMEEKIVDHYNLDIIRYPKVRFDISRISGMEEYRSLIPF